MKIKITKKNNDQDAIIVSFAKESLEISKQSDAWNSKGISDFLTKLASQVPPQEALEINFDDQNQEEIYKYVVQLFQLFVDQYNQEIKNQQLVENDI